MGDINRKPSEQIVIGKYYWHTEPLKNKFKFTLYRKDDALKLGTIDLQDPTDYHSDLNFIVPLDTCSKCDISNMDFADYIYHKRDLEQMKKYIVQLFEERGIL